MICRSSPVAAVHLTICFDQQPYGVIQIDARLFQRLALCERARKLLLPRDESV
jgi:hypothetical protein